MTCYFVTNNKDPEKRGMSIIPNDVNRLLNENIIYYHSC